MPPAPAKVDPDEDALELFFPHELAGGKVEFAVAGGDTLVPAPASPTAETATATAEPATPETAPEPAPPPPAAGPVVVAYAKGATSGTPVDTVPLDGGSLSLAFLAKAFAKRDLTFADSPFFLKGPPPPTTLPKPDRPHKVVSVKGKVGLNFGKDKLKITGAFNGAGGASASGGVGVGLAAGAAGGQGASGTGGAKPYTITPVFEIGPLLKAEEGVIIAIRCVLRYFYHWCDALNLSIDYFKYQVPKQQTAGDVMTGLLGYNWWMLVFSMFAMKDMLFDIVTDEADFIAELLQKIGVEAKLDLGAGGSADMGVGVDVQVMVAGKAYLPLAVMLAPFIEFLMAGSTAKAPEGAGLADKILPYLECTLEDRICVAAGGLPAALQVELKGKLATLTFSVPKGSPLREKIEKSGKQIFAAADHYKNRKVRTLPDEMKVLRLVLALLDAEVEEMVALVKAGKAAAGGDSGAASQGADALSAGFSTAAPYVKQILDALQGKAVTEPVGIGPDARRVLDALRHTSVPGVAIGMDGPCTVADSGERKLVVLHVTDTEKARLAGVGFSPTAAPALETTRLEVVLPVTPQLIGWNHVAQNPDLGRDYAGVVGGFDQASDRDRCKDQCLARGWVPGELGTYDDQHPDDSQGRHWAWVGVGLSEILAERYPEVPMPELALLGSILRVTFDELPIGAIGDDLRRAVPFFAAASLTRETIWKLTLMEAATREEAEDIQAQVDANQPDEDPYATPILDELLGS